MDSTNNKYVHSAIKQNATQFSIETYFIWFSALIFITEAIIDVSLVTYYINKNHLKWGIITLAIILVPFILCQVYSIMFLRSEKKSNFVLLFHVLPYRYFKILRKIDKDKMNNQEMDLVKQGIKEINSIQILNAILQYFPQFIFQAYLISFRKYKYVITGISAGLGGFAFLWHIFIYFYYVIKRYSDDSNLSTRIIDNLSSTSETCRNISPGSSLSHSQITGKLKNFEKPLYNTDDKNFVSKKQLTKNIEKEHIFSFNKRKPIYKQEEFDLYDINNQSTEFYELNESGASNSNNTVKINSTTTLFDNSYQFNNENNLNLNLFKISDDIEKGESSKIKFVNLQNNDNNNSSDIESHKTNSLTDNRGVHLKRKGICSSQEMLHLVDIMNDISPEHAKHLAELSGEESLNISENGELDNNKLLELFPKLVDQKTLENIDAVIYENQIIFQERIRKNQLTIQNLKLQDEILSNAIIESKLINHNQNNSLNNDNNDTTSMHNYDSIYFSDVNRLNRLKHWRNYLNDLDTNLHDNSTVLNSSIYMFTTTSNSTYTDLYINEANNINENNKYDKIDNIKEKKKCVHWCDKHKIINDNNSFDDGNINDDLYININNDNEVDDDDGAIGNNNSNLLEKNILVETINKIYVDSPTTSTITTKQLKQKLHFDNNNRICSSDD